MGQNRSMGDGDRGGRVVAERSQVGLVLGTADPGEGSDQGDAGWLIGFDTDRDGQRVGDIEGLFRGKGKLPQVQDRDPADGRGGVGQALDELGQKKRHARLWQRAWRSHLAEMFIGVAHDRVSRGDRNPRR
jgi:hypothetical protein